MLDRLRKVAASKGANVSYLLDTKGPEIRTAMMKGGQNLQLNKGQEIVLVAVGAEYKTWEGGMNPDTGESCMGLSACSVYLWWQKHPQCRNHVSCKQLKGESVGGCWSGVQYVHYFSILMVVFDCPVGSLSYCWVISTISSPEFSWITQQKLNGPTGCEDKH